MAASSSEICLVEETPEAALSMDQDTSVEDKGHQENKNEEPMKKEEESPEVQIKECVGKTSEIQSPKTHSQVLKPGPGVPKWFSKRWIFCYANFGLVFFAIATRVGMNVAIVSMVKKKTPLNNTDLTNIDPACNSSIQNLEETDRGEFEWSDFLVANIIGGFYYGYTFTNVLGGLLADRYGGRRIIGYSLLITSLLLLIYPVLSRVSGYWTLTLRVISGMVAGPFYPGTHSLWGRWAPPVERGRLMAISNTGTLIGHILTLSLSGYLCAYGFDNGWGSVFYLTGATSFLYSLLWFYLVYDTPQKHPSITKKELDFLEKAIQCQARVRNIPWKSIMTSGTVWAIIIAHFCSNWTVFSVETILPQFMKEVLYFDIGANGFMSSVPYIGMLVSFTFVGSLADFLIRRRYLTVRGTRIFMQCTSFIGTASFLVATSFIKCSDAAVAIWFLFFAGVFMGFCAAGFLVNHVDIAPSYAGLLFGVTNTVSALPGFLAPTLADALTPNGTQEEWQNVFFVCCSLAVLGAIAFAILAGGEVQEWAKHPHQEVVEIQEDGNIGRTKKI